MRSVIYLPAALLPLALFLVNPGGTGTGTNPGNHAGNTAEPPELEYLKAVNSVGPPKDPQLLFLLMAQYSNLNLQGEGAEFISARFKEFEPRLADPQKALYLSAIALLRAQHASSVSLLHRIGYVNDTIAMLDRARQMSGGQIFVVNWIAGVVHSELPGLFRQSKAAETELAWCLDHADRAPHAGWLREVDYHLGKLALARRRTREGGGVSTKERLQRLEPAHHADHTLFRGRRHRTYFRSTAHRGDFAGTRVRVDGLRVHRVLFRRIGGWAGIDRHRCRYPAGFREDRL